jgi:hypothetical protein
MFGKQLFLDIIVIVSIPALLIGIYFLWFRAESGPLLSAKSEMLRVDPNEPGNQTKLALQSLQRITLNDAVFKSPSYFQLQIYTVEIKPSELSREYPFSPTVELSEMLRRTKVTTRTPIVNQQAKVGAVSISEKLDQLKSGAR